MIIGEDFKHLELLLFMNVDNQWDFVNITDYYVGKGC